MSWFLVRGAGLVALGLGLTGCPDAPYYDSAAFFANTTHDPASVRFFDLAAELDCQEMIGRSGVALSRPAFGEGMRYDVAPGQVLPIQYSPLDASNSYDTNERCGAALVQVPGVPPLEVFWPTPSCGSSDRQVSSDNPGFRDCSVRLEGGGGLLGLAVGKKLEGTSEREEVPPVDPPRPFGWSGSAAATTLTINGIDSLPDGCLSVHHATGTLYLCVPSWAFPFAVGDSVSSLEQTVPRAPAPPSMVPPSSSTSPSSSSKVPASQAPERLLRLSGRAATLEIVLGAANATSAGVNGSIARRGEGSLTACGAYVLPLAVQSPGAASLAGSGDLIDGTSGSSRTRVLVGRAERVIVAPSACDPERAAVGDRIDFLKLTTLEAP